MKEFLQEFPNNPPVVNQLEVHPWLARKEICEFCKEQGIVVVAYSPLAKAKRLLDPVVLDISSARPGRQKKSWAQIVLRWNVQKGRAVIPNSTNAERIKENAQIFDFELSEDEMKRLDELDEYFVTSWDPTTITN